jgi:hypothetical protein
MYPFADSRRTKAAPDVPEAAFGYGLANEAAAI